MLFISYVSGWERHNPGLDIGSSYIKTVQLKDIKGGYELELFDILPLPPEIIVDGSIIDSFRLIDSIKELVRKTKIRTRNSVIGIAGHSSVIIKKISLPEMSEEELSESIKFEAEQYVPFNIEDVNLDFQILGPKDEPGQMDVILVAVKDRFRCEYFEGMRPWFAKCVVALPCATQNEVTGEDAQMLVKHGCVCVSEGANMPTTLDGVNVFLNKKILYGPGKAANAGGVAVSGLEVSQNTLRLSWTREEVDQRLHGNMKSIHSACVETAKEYGDPGNYVIGANISGFIKIANTMIDQGLVVSPGRSRGIRSGGGGAVLPLRVWTHP